MIESDTVKLLQECDSGIKMGVSSIGEILKYVKDAEFRQLLETCKFEHEELKTKVQTLLDKHHDGGKEPTPIAKSMSWIKTNVKLVINESDHTVADLITEGCNMGVKSLNRYLNQYKAANEPARDIAEKLIRLEDQLAADIRKFL